MYSYVEIIPKRWLGLKRHKIIIIFFNVSAGTCVS